MDDKERLVKQFEELQKAEKKRFEELLNTTPLKHRLDELTLTFGEDLDIVEDWGHAFLPSNVMYFYVHSEFQFREKTKEERDADRHSRAEEIIQQHTRKTCITCLQVIRPDHELVTTIHGFYHGAPNNCVEGR